MSLSAMSLSAVSLAVVCVSLSLLKTAKKNNGYYVLTVVFSGEAEEE